MSLDISTEKVKTKSSENVTADQIAKKSLCENFRKYELAIQAPCFCSQRWILAYAAFFGFLCLYAVRFNLSVGIVCMVKTKTENVSITNSLNQTNTTTDVQCIPSESSSSSNEHAEFDWNKDTKSNILSAFFYGYLTTQILGGWFADKYGGRLVNGLSFTVCGICTVLTPIFARTSVILVYVVRVILGIASGSCFPAMTSMWGRWAPPLERSKLVTFYSIGPTFGSVVTFISSGYLCEYGFDNGWGSIFYVTGGLTLVSASVWFLIARNRPSEHPWISEAEQKYITGSIEYDIDNKKLNVPWLSILKSVPLYATTIAEICSAWIFYTILTSIPQFMKAVLKFDIKNNGLFSSLPSICYFCVVFIAGQTADIIRKSGILTTRSTRKVFQSVAFIGSAVFIILAGFTSCENRYTTVAYICLAMGFIGFGGGGTAPNLVDIGPKYAGVLMGITNMVANVSGVLTPIVAGKLTPNDTKEEWRNVFYVCAAFNIFGFLVFTIFASGEVQPWAKDDSEKDITVTKM